MRPLDLTGKKFGRLTVQEQAPHKLGSHTRWRCVCECGKETIVRGSSLSQNLTQSCGCIISENAIKSKTVHGLYYHPNYHIWAGMMDRCYNRNSPDYRNYGGRGIFVDPEWHSVVNFIRDMGGRPPTTSLDRINNSANYGPGNCRWATAVEQCNNTRRNRLFEYNGKKLTVAQWERELGLRRSVLSSRLTRGQPFDFAVEKALQRNPANNQVNGVGMFDIPTLNHTE